jgi:predicted phage terminase large subunit-like protein
MNSLIEEKELLKAQLWGSFLLFVRTFFPLVTGREFTMSHPIGRESHFITVARELTLVARLQTPSLLINMPPGYAKSTLVSMWVAWTLSLFKNSQYLYISYGKHLAEKHTDFIKRVIMCPHYRNLFDIEIRGDSKAKGDFETKDGGVVSAFGSTGPITGRNAGLPNCEHFSGAVIIDDAHKPDEVHSDTIRDSVIKNYNETILQRPRGPNVPIMFIGQCLHEADLALYLRSGKDERTWKYCVLKALDEAGNALHPEVNSKEQLLEKQEKNPYVFASQYQQDPIPAGGALYKERDFVILYDEPEILMTFITVDSAETSKTYNDATVFSFFGVYKIRENGLETGQLGLHWIDCIELRIEPKDLVAEFMSFYTSCLLHKVKPLIAAIEKKSTGVTLISVLGNVRGLQIREVHRTKASGSKTERFLEMQPIIAAKIVSFSEGAKHIKLCIEHMMKITANDSHRFDDIADTLYDACKIAIIDRALGNFDMGNQNKVVQGLAADFRKKLNARTASYATDRRHTL